MKSAWLACIAFALAANAHASDLNVQIVGSTGSNVLRVFPGAVVPYQVIGTLSDANSAGLGMFTLDLSFSGGPLSPLGTPNAAPMNHFALPLGFNNPAGFGGTLVAGSLLQIGGAQNTINNTVAPTPNGPVLLNVAQPGSPAVLGAGFLSAPYRVGVASVSGANLAANVIAPGQSGVPFWTVEDASNGTISPLTVQVEAIRSNASVLSVGLHQSARLTISAGPANAGRSYIMLGSLSGTTPGTTLPGGANLPLNQDRYFDYTQNNPNSAILNFSAGTLDSNGRSVVVFTPNARFANQVAQHAFYLVGPTDFVSEAESITVIP
jgi:hypothetical protein